MPAIYHEGSWLGNATDPEALVKDTVGWTGKNRAYSQTNNAVVAHIENGITYDVSWTGSATVTLKKNSTSGATITSGSTSPLSFTADADYELYFGSSATVTNIMVKDSRITDPTYEPYHESVEEEIEQIYADNGVLGAKNLLQNTATSQTINGLTFTVNNDKSVTVNGTATATTNFALKMTPEFDGAVIMSGCPSGGAENKYSIQYSSWVSGVLIYADYGEGVIIPTAFNKSTYPNARIFINITNGQTISNLTFYPMLRLASDPDDTYQPYAMTNRELTDAVSVEPLNIALSASDKATKLRDDSRRCGNVVNIRVQLQVTAEIANNTEIFRLNGLPHVGYAMTILGETNTGEIIPMYIVNSPSGFVAYCRKAIPTGYYAISYTYVI